MKPIIFSADDVRATLDGRKTMTRRVIKPQPTYWYEGECVYERSGIVGPEMYSPFMVDKYGEFMPGKEVYGIYSDDGEYGCKAPYKPGDVLWVRETWAEISTQNFRQGGYDQFILYRADKYKEIPSDITWRLSIHMPREAARLYLRVTDVRAERVQDISTSNCEREGIASDIDRFNGLMTPHHDWIVGEFARLWDTLNAKRGYGWDSNPWVWVYEFERVERGAEL